MKVVILAGGLGTRISEETHLKPKPMIEIGNRPIIWHIMKLYSFYGINDFIICCGYKGYVIKEYFANYFLHASNVTFDLANQTTEVHENASEQWRVTLVDTGEHTLTGGRLKRVQRYVGNSRFCLTYGDGVSDVNIPKLLEHHEKTGAIVTLTAVQPPGRFGSVEVYDSGFVNEFVEKPRGDGGWINGGFFVAEPDFFDYVGDDMTPLEREPLERAAKEGKLGAYKHYGFWQALDTVRDRNALNDLWNEGKAPWKVYDLKPPTDVETEPVEHQGFIKNVLINAASGVGDNCLN